MNNVSSGTSPGKHVEDAWARLTQGKRKKKKKKKTLGRQIALDDPPAWELDGDLGTAADALVNTKEFSIPMAIIIYCNGT